MMNKRALSFRYFFGAGLLALFAIAYQACNNDYVPKPRGYFRIALPEKKYRVVDSIYPFVFACPVYASISNDPESPAEKNWINLNFPAFSAKLHISHKYISSSHPLPQLTEDARTLAFKHIPKSNGIHQILIDDPKNHVYGMVYDIKGLGAASPYQFFLTDSTKNFVRGALYFSVSPNNDSLEPVITFLKTDIQHFIETLQWK